MSVGNGVGNGMKLSNGIDLVQVSRIREGFERHGESYFARFLTTQELADCRRRDSWRFESVAARFAAKEALAKALGTGIAHGVNLREIEVVRVVSGGADRGDFDSGNVDGGAVDGGAVANGNVDGGDVDGGAVTNGGVAYQLHGSTAAVFTAYGWQHSSLSLSHDGGLAIASCVIWSER